MKIENVKIYDLEESIIASGYPMKNDLKNIDYEIINLQKWSSYGDFIFDFIEYQDKYDKEYGLNTKDSCFKCGSSLNVQFNTKFDKYACSKHNHQLERYGKVFEITPKYIIYDNYVKIEVVGDKQKRNDVLIDLEDLPKIFYKNLNVNEYCNVYDKNTEKSINLHRYIFEDLDDGTCIDHINRNKLDCRKSNLRICDTQKNSINIDIPSNNTSGFIGVNYRKDRDVWRASIVINGKQINLGHFKNKKDAIISRLYAEKEYFGEFSPQRHLFEQYDIEPIIETNLCNDKMCLNLTSAINHLKRFKKLGMTGGTSGHNQAYTGIRVAFDLTFTNKAWIELERYRFVEFVSSQSTMHRLSKFDLKSQYNEYVDKRIIDIMEELKNNYNKTNDKEDYLRLLYSNPSGFNLTARLTTNYRALKTVYSQRKNHKLPEWREFCRWIETLPYFKELCIKKEESNV